MPREAGFAITCSGVTLHMPGTLVSRINPSGRGMPRAWVPLSREYLLPPPSNSGRKLIGLQEYLLGGGVNREL